MTLFFALSFLLSVDWRNSFFPRLDNTFVYFLRFWFGRFFCSLRECHWLLLNFDEYQFMQSLLYVVLHCALYIIDKNTAMAKWHQFCCCFAFRASFVIIVGCSFRFFFFVGVVGLVRRICKYKLLREHSHTYIASFFHFSNSNRPYWLFLAEMIHFFGQ